MREAALIQEHTVFLGAAVRAVLAGLAALLLFGWAATRALSPGEVLRRLSRSVGQPGL